jgi:dTDP-4-dehydrorhamnose 3,5-epimerase
MNFIDTNFDGVLLWQPAKIEDNRGYFCEVFSQKNFPINFETYQINQSKSTKNVVRGLHLQTPPFAQAKIIRVLDGKILDILLDLRQNSKTFGKYFAVELSAQNGKTLFAPEGFAHGFSVLSDEATIIYQVNAPYSPQNQRTIKFDDEDLKIDWQLTGPAQTSAADKAGESFKNYLKNPVF